MVGHLCAHGIRALRGLRQNCINSLPEIRAQLGISAYCHLLRNKPVLHHRGIVDPRCITSTIGSTIVFRSPTTSEHRRRASDILDGITHRRHLGLQSDIIDNALDAKQGVHGVERGIALEARRHLPGEPHPAIVDDDFHVGRQVV